MVGGKERDVPSVASLGIEAQYARSSLNTGECVVCCMSCWRTGEPCVECAGGGL